MEGRARLEEEARHIGWSGSWSCALGTGSMLMNNGGDEKTPEMETGEEAGRDVHLTGGGGGVLHWICLASMLLLL